MRARSGTVFVHTSDELYGSDRVLLDVLAALPDAERARAEVWLPTDVPHGTVPLCRELQRVHPEVRVRHLAVPVLRRAYRTPGRLASLALKALVVALRLAWRRPRRVYCTTSAAFVVAPIARVVRVPQVVGHVQELWSSGDTRALAPLARSCHLLVAISGPVRAALPAVLQGRTAVVVNATREPGPDGSMVDRTGPLSFLVASRWNAWKGHRTLLEAWDRLEEPGRLVVLGGPPPSGEAVDVPALVAQMRHRDSVDVVGEVTDPDPWFRDCDVVVVPSDQPEPFGLVAIEAFARGRPVLGSRGGGLAETVTHDHDGWLFPRGDVDALVSTLARLTREQVREAGRAARASYEDRFTVDRYAEQWRAAVLREQAPTRGVGRQLPPEMAE